MNKDQLIKFIQNPEQITDNDSQVLKDVVRDFPFFHSAHLLLLYNLKKINDPQLGQQLNESAIYIADRQKLFNLLNGISSATQKKEIPVSIELQPVIDKKILASENVTPENSQNKLLELDENAELGAYTAINNPDDQHLPEQSSVTYTSSSHQAFELEQETTVDNNKSDDNIPKASPDLIEKFIEENPAFVPRKLELTNNQDDISLLSIVEDEEVATETLATIYTNQKLYDKAIAVYEKLILKFPEKRAYFATQILEIKKNLN